MTADPAARALEYFTAKMSFTTGPVELSKRVTDGSVRVVDVRAPEDFAAEHIPGSINLPETEWPNASKHGLADDKPNVLLCYSQVCHLAARAAVELAGQGLPVMELEGGFKGWKEHRLPVEKGSHPAAGDRPVDRARELLAETREAQQKESAEKPSANAEPDGDAKADAKANAQDAKGARAEADSPDDEADGGAADDDDGATARRTPATRRQRMGI